MQVVEVQTSQRIQSAIQSGLACLKSATFNPEHTPRPGTPPCIRSQGSWGQVPPGEQQPPPGGISGVTPMQPTDAERPSVVAGVLHDTYSHGRTISDWPPWCYQQHPRGSVSRLVVVTNALPDCSQISHSSLRSECSAHRSGSVSYLELFNVKLVMQVVHDSCNSDDKRNPEAEGTHLHSPSADGSVWLELALDVTAWSSSALTLTLHTNSSPRTVQ